MLSFLRKSIRSRRLISPTVQHSLFLQNQWLPSTARYCTSIAFNAHSFTVSYLIRTCGFSPQEANSATKYVTFETPEKPNLVINFLKNLGFTKPQILRLTKEVPQLLRCDPEKSLLPKIEFFKSKGVPSSDIPKLLCSCPNIMRRSLHKQLIPSFDFFRGLIQSDEQFIKTITRCSGILLDINTHAVPNMKLLREVGVSESNIINMLQLYPRAFSVGTEKFKKILQQVQEMGIDPSLYQFIMAVYALSSLSKATWSKKTNVYKKWGWSDDEIMFAFRRSPNCMKVSEDKIDAIMKILVDKLGCPLSSIPNYAVVLSLSLSKRIAPRASVLQVLLSKGLVKKESLLSTFVYTDKEFLRRYILNHGEEGNKLLKLYQAKLGLSG